MEKKEQKESEQEKNKKEEKNKKKGAKNIEGMRPSKQLGETCGTKQLGMDSKLKPISISGNKVGKQVSKGGGRNDRNVWCN